jgi:hypothetical protein
LENKIVTLGRDFHWPSSGAHLTEVLESAEAFTRLVLLKIPGMGLPKAISEGVTAELKKQTSRLFVEIRGVVGRIYSTKLFSQGLQLLEVAIAQFKVELPEGAMRSLSQGRLIAKDLDGLIDAQAGLTVLIDIWGILSVQERADYFKNENKSLFDFLSKQDARELSCLRLAGCSGGIINGIAKKLFILPQIKDYGIEQLKAKLNEKTLHHMIGQIESFAQTFIGTLPAAFITQINSGLAAKDQELQIIQKNYPDYLKDLLAKWAGKAMPGTDGKVAGFESSMINVQISGKNRMFIEAAGSSLDLKADTAGSAMTANALFLQNSPQHSDFKMRTALSQVNKLIAIGGYRDDAQKLVPALMMPIEKTRAFLDLMTFTKSDYSYRIPDKIKMLDSFHASAQPYAKNFSASAYAEQLKGLSHMINFTADWKRTGFEDSLGKVKAQELTSEIQNPALARPLFPKDLLFALNIGDAAVLLKNITKKSTPVFLVTLNDKTIWADQYQPGGEDTAIMAGLVDIKEGQRSTTVQGQDVANFILAIQEFLSATEGVERTQSAILLEKDIHGVTPLKALLEGREELKLLTIALANFVSSQLLNEQSLVQATFSLTKMQKSNEENFQIEDQAVAIRALLAAWKITGMEAYLWSAHEIYFAMNKNAFDSEEHFYVNGDGSVLGFPQKVNTLRALVELNPSLPPASQTQLARVLAPWVRALEELP